MDLLIFDLDGTLIDSRLDLANAVNATRRHLGMDALTNERVYSYVGNGAPVLIRRALGDQATEAEVQEALEYFLEYYGAHDLDYTTLYPGVKAALDRFRDAGKKLAVLTNKPVRMTHHIVGGLGIGEHFFRIYGGNSFEHKKPDRVGIDRLRKEVGAALADTWMVGDSYVDVQTARNAEVNSCGVRYGFQPETFREYPPDLLVERMEEFAGYLEQRNSALKR